MKTAVHRHQRPESLTSAPPSEMSEKVQVQSEFSQNDLLVMEDHVHLTIGLHTQQRFLLLFTDTLIIAKDKYGLKLKEHIPLYEVWLASCVGQVTEKSLSSKKSFVIGWPTVNYVITVRSAEAKARWMCALQWYITKSRQDFCTNKIFLKVALLCDKDGMITVSADASTTAENVIQTLILHSRLRGSPSEYQLWVLNEREEDPYPLIGHELPFWIFLSFLRDSDSGQHTLSSRLLTADGRHHVNVLPEDSNTPHFVLRAKASNHVQATLGSFPKHKRRRNLIDWAFRRGHNSQSDDRSDSSPHNLFGQPLTSVCHHGNLPQPILHILFLLYREGPETQGIFRRSANAKSCRLVKERLDRGVSAPLQGESVFVAASVLTEFLRKLPGSVMVSDLYEKWMEAFRQEDEQSKTSELKSLLEKLPQLNAMLLQCVFCVLHRIHMRWQENQMTASNLALCIAPNMLWPPDPRSAQEESHATAQVAALVQFLIENTPSIFGDSVEGLFRERMSATRETDADPLPHVQASSEETIHETERSGGGVFSSSLFSEERPCFLPLSMLSLREDTPCLSHTCPLMVSRATGAGTSSCGALDSVPCSSSGSVCSLGTGGLSETRHRCLSEPSVFLFPPHPTVTRQSSCDAAVTGQRTYQSQGSTSQPSPRRYAFWRSPQIPARFRQPGQRLASMSSLSSTATSSLSSLDSALSVSSSVPSPSSNETQPRPFLFGAAARLRPLTPDMPRKLWSMAFHYEEDKREGGEEEEGEEELRGFQEDWATTFSSNRNKGDQNKSEEGEKREDKEEKGERESFSLRDKGSVLSLGTQSGHTDGVGGMKMSVCDVISVNTLKRQWHDPDSHTHAQTQKACSSEEVSQGNSDQTQHDNDVWEAENTHTQSHHILPSHTDGSAQSESQERTPAPVRHKDTQSTERLVAKTHSHKDTQSTDQAGAISKTKITLLTIGDRVTVKDSEIIGHKNQDYTMVTGKGSTLRVAMDTTSPASHLVQVHLPQTVFYGQNVPLLVRSTSSMQRDTHSPTNTAHACHREDSAEESRNATEGSAVDFGINADDDVRRALCVSPGHVTRGGSVTHILPKPSHKAAGTVRHTIRIKLPATVRGYFSSRSQSYTHVNTCPQAGDEAQRGTKESSVSARLHDESFV